MGHWSLILQGSEQKTLSSFLFMNILHRRSLRCSTNPGNWLCHHPYQCQGSYRKLCFFNGLRPDSPRPNWIQATPSSRIPSKRTRQCSILRWPDLFYLRVSSYSRISRSSLTNQSGDCDRFLANLVATVFMIMNLSPVMSIIFNVPSTVVCAVRVIHRLPEL